MGNGYWGLIHHSRTGRFRHPDRQPAPGRGPAPRCRLRPRAGPGSGCSAPSATRRRRSCEAMPIGGTGMVQIGRVPGPRSGRWAGSNESIPGRLTTTIVASCAIRPGSSPGGEVGQAVGADQEEEFVVGPVAADRVQGLDAVVRAGPAASRGRRPRTRGDPPRRSGPSPGGGSRPSDRPACAAAHRRPRTRRGRGRTPRGTARPGSGAPGGSGRTSPRRALVASSRPALRSFPAYLCGQACRNRVNWRVESHGAA